jgi:hypothetical protein
MSTILLYHAFGIRGYESVRTAHEGGEVIFTICQYPEDCRCSARGSREVTSRGHPERRFVACPSAAEDFRGPADPSRRMSDLWEGASDRRTQRPA